MFGKSFGEYVRFQRWILILIALVFLARLGVSLAGVPLAQGKWVSINFVLLVGLVYCAVAVHTAGYGAYKQLLGLLLVQVFFAHLLIASGIALGVLTGVDNIFTAPEFFGGADGKNWGHVLAHLVGGVVLALLSWLIGSLILLVTRKLIPTATVEARRV
jgi:hypothetical protein